MDQNEAELGKVGFDREVDPQAFNARVMSRNVVNFLVSKCAKNCITSHVCSEKSAAKVAGPQFAPKSRFAVITSVGARNWRGGRHPVR